MIQLLGFTFYFTSWAGCEFTAGFLSSQVTRGCCRETDTQHDAATSRLHEGDDGGLLFESYYTEIATSDELQILHLLLKKQNKILTTAAVYSVL